MENLQDPASFQFSDKPHIMVVEARFYDDISDMLLNGAKDALEEAGVTYEVITVPGALEIPAAIMYAVKSLDFDPVRRRFDGYVALGAVIKGETRHDIIVGDNSARGLQEIALANTLAIGNGILTVDNKAQAIDRADPSKQNKGAAVANACLRMIEIKQQFKLNPKRRWVGR
jgi:6,7-dimethyl-8-ribityllumazine synthase